MVHVSDMSWTRKINNPSEMVKKGDEVDAIVVEVDIENQRISLGMKQFTQDPWEDIDRLYKLGDVIREKLLGSLVMVPLLSLKMRSMV